LVPGPKKEIVLHSLRNEAPPQFGRAKTLGFLARNADGTEVDGAGQMLRYTFDEWPEEDFTVAVRARVRALPQGRVGQVFSAWAAGMDDPLRIVVDGGRLFARVEAGAFFSTPGTSILGDRWYAIVAVKRGGQLMLHLDGKLAGSCAVPEYSQTRATECALGGNPNYGGNEFLAARFADFGFYARAWDDAEIRHWSATP
jgi:hypothetical protein